MNRRLACGLLSAVALTTFTTPVFAQKGKPRPALPPVRYELRLIEAPADWTGSGDYRAMGMNNVGQVVGGYVTADGWNKGFLCDPLVDANQAVRLSTLVDPLDVREGWEIRRAAAINDEGTIIGVLAPVGVSLYTEGIGFVLYGAGTEFAMLLELPRSAAPEDAPWPTVQPRVINDDGDILCTFVENGAIGAYVYNPLVDNAPLILPMPLLHEQWLGMNNSAGTSPPQVVGHLATGEIFRYTLGAAAPDVFPGMNYFSRSEYIVKGINDAGLFCGRWVNKYPAFLTDGVTTQAVSLSRGAQALNGSGDMISQSQAQMYHQGTGVLTLGDLLVGDAADLAVWSEATLKNPVDLTDRVPISNDPNVPGYPAVAVNLSRRDVFVLTPVPAP